MSLPIEAVFAQEEEIVKQLESLGNDSFGTGLFKYVSYRGIRKLFYHKRCNIEEHKSYYIPSILKLSPYVTK